MSSHRARLAAAAILIPIATAALAAAPTQQLASSALVLSRDSSGISGTYHVGGAIDTRNPFFKVLGTNGRTCATCHLLTQAMSFTPEYAQEKFNQTRGSDPLFA